MSSLPAALPPSRVRILSALWAGAALAYVGARAVRIPFTHDESKSYLNFIGRSYGHILTPYAPNAANNHVLNSLLARTSALAFGPSEWALRLPNVLAFALYLGCALWLARRFSSGVAAACFCALFAGNPFLLELFALARGYGLGLGFLAAFLVLLVAIEERPDRGLPWALAAGASAALSITANFTFLLPTGALLLVAAIRLRHRSWTIVTGVLSPLLLLAVAVGPWIAKLKARGQFYTGGSIGFVHDTLGSLVDVSVAEWGRGPAARSAAWVVLLLCTLLGVAALLLRSCAGGKRIAGLVVPALFLAAIGSIVQHATLGTPYLADRTAVFFLPLLAACGAAGVDVFASAAASTSRAAGRAIGLALAAAVAWNAARSANVDHAQLWRYDADAARVVADLTSLHETGETRIHLGGNWVFEPALNFYRETRRLAWLDPVLRNDPFELCNVLLLSLHEPLSYAHDEFVEVRRYPRFGNYLLHRVRSPGSGRVWHEDATLTGSLDDPAEDSVVLGSLRLHGWAREAGRDLGVRFLLDGIPQAISVSRVPRPDVAIVLPALGDCGSAGYEAVIPFDREKRGTHEIIVVFTSEDFRQRHYPARRFDWRLP